MYRRTEREVERASNGCMSAGSRKGVLGGEDSGTLGTPPYPYLPLTKLDLK